MVLGNLSNQELLDKIGVLILGLDTHGRISLINKRGAELLGTSVEQLIGRDWSTHFLPPEEKLPFQTLFTQIMAGELQQGEYHENYILTCSGEKRLIGWHNTIIDDSTGKINGIFCTGEDITQRKQAEENLRISELRLRLFADHAADAFFLYDQQGRFIDVNRQACSSLDYSREELLTLGVADIDPDFPQDRIPAAISQILQTEGPTVFRGTHRRRDGFTFPVEIKIETFVRGDMPLFVAVARDISLRVQQEQQLQNSLELLRTIINSIPDIICVKDGEGRWLLANDFDLQLFKLEGIEFQGKTDAELAPFSPFYEQAFLTCMDTDETAWAAGAPIRAEEEIPRPDGSTCIFDVYKIPLFNGDGSRQALVVTGRDISENKRIEERYRSLFEQSPLPYLAISISGSIEVVNQATCTTFGYSRNELEEKPLSLFLTAKSRELLAIHFPRFLTDSLLSGNNYEIYRADGSLAIIQISATVSKDKRGQPLLIHCIISDITDRVRAETERIRLATAIEQVSESILITDTDGKIEYVNPAFETNSGYTFEDVRGHTPNLLKSGHHKESFYQEMWHTLNQGLVWRGQLTNRRKDGTLFSEDATISPIRSPDGVLTHYVGVKRNVSREIELEKQLNQATKMEAIGTLAGGIAHDFNNILTAILGYAEIVNMRLPAADPAKEDIAQVIAAGKRAADLVEQILTFSRKEAEELRPLKLHFVVKEALKLLRSSLPTTIEIQRSIDSSCGTIKGVPNRIHQLLMNLCTNAKQAMGEEGGILQVSLDEYTIDSDPSVSLHESIAHGRWLDLMVSDTGCGMDEPTRERIFEPFFTTKKQGEGTGLGLSVVHGIVKNHGGEITVCSQPGKGTTFHIYLPVIENEKRRDGETHPEPLRGNSECILLVDDEVTVLDLMEKILVNLGYRVLSTTDSVAALQLFKEKSTSIDLIITDMTMPHLTGTNLARKILAIRPDIPIILYTGYSEYVNAEQAKIAGICEFITKPVDSNKLARVIRKLLTEKK